jgi:uncharacterized protein (DUF1697 family)
MRYVALLRGINVGGNTMIKMEDLRAMFEGLGFENVVSYINSGNLAFDVGSPHVSKGSLKTLESELCSTIEKAIEADLGKPVQVMVRRQEDIDDVLSNNPFDGQFESHKEMHVLFLKDKLPAESEQFLKDAIPPGERFICVGREIYCHLPMGVADSYLGRGQFERKLKISVTARNWRTVQKLAEL